MASRNYSPLWADLRPKRIAGWVAAGAALLTVGVAIGDRVGSSPSATPIETSPPPRAIEPQLAPAAPATRTRSGAVAAAAASITAFDGAVLLDPTRLRAVVTQIAATKSRAVLLQAFEEGSAQTRAKLGVDTVPSPVIVLRSAPVGYRLERFSGDEATVAVWYVGVVGSGATVEPQQSWRTQLVTLVWESGAWKVTSFESSPGPTPPLASDTSDAPGDLFATIPSFEEFVRVAP
jgi:hypothetical protein